MCSNLIQNTSSLNWLKNGDRNTKYFHAIASAKRVINFILQITIQPHDPQQPPQTITQSPLILKEFNEYYRNLLGTKQIASRTPNLSTLYPNHTTSPHPSHTLTGGHDYLCPLIDPITLTEVRHVIFALPKDKASGSDGFSIEFFQNYWDTVRNDIFQAVNAFYHNRLDLWCINQAHITLIPKKNETKLISDFRSISVLSILLKIITKILAMRLQPFLPNLIHQNQATFIKGRQLMQTFLSARELMTYLHKRRIPAVFFKIDFAKAFDTLSWDYILEVLHARGFPALWILDKEYPNLNHIPHQS
jgi:Reverse transcriptase (RNA-dependent DNA polymerase)